MGLRLYDKDESETSNSTFEERLVFDDQTTSGSGIVKSYFTDPANNKILILDLRKLNFRKVEFKKKISCICKN